MEQIEIKVKYPEVEQLEIKVKYHDESIVELCPIGGNVKSNWIDLRAAEDVQLKAGEYKAISLGVSIKLPDGYEALVAPRSSTFVNFGILMVNSIGVIDNSYCGDNDIWKFPAYAVKDTEIHKGDRVCQFRIIKNQPGLLITKVDKMEDTDRGGFGSTGTA